MGEVHDMAVCEECHYMKIDNYSLRERHCKKCDNYGEKILPANARIIQRPVEVKIECPHCDYEIEIEYREFESLMPSTYPGDWGGTVLQCPECEKQIEIDDYEWN